MKKIVFLIAALVCAGLLSSCHHHHHHDHEHEEPGQQIALYGDNYELFAETSPAIVGQQLEVLTHLTDLKSFHPIDSGRVSVVLTVGGKSLSAVLDAPSKRGIYKLVLTPEMAGVGRLEWTLPDGSKLHYDSLAVYADHEAYEAVNHEKPAPPNSVAFTKEQSWVADFATAVVEPVQFGGVIKTSAQVLPSQGDEREAVAKASGIVVFASADLVEGAEVKAGQRLFAIESRGMADDNMNVRYQEAKANYEVAKADYDRKQSLSADRIVSQSELERSRAAYESAKAVYDNLKGNFSPNGAAVTAPMSGYVKRINVANGAFVEAGTPVVSITQNKDLFIRAELQPRYYGDLKNIETANFVVPGKEGVYSLEEMDGSLVSFGKATTADSPLLPVTFRFRNTADLMSGSFVTLYIRLRSDKESLVLPNTGIVEEMGNYFVFVQVHPELFEKRLVTLGETDGKCTVIASGLRSGERVVTKGATMVKLAQGAGALDPHAGHVH